MRFLLTNDDGIYAKGLSALYRELSKEADCLIVAPEIEQSAVGHAITIFRPLMVRRATKNANFLGYAVCGTPADCVKIGIKELSEKPVDWLFRESTEEATPVLTFFIREQFLLRLKGLYWAFPLWPFPLTPIKKLISPMPPNSPAK